MRALRRAARAAFPVTLPVLTGYVFLGIAFGILLQSRGYGPGWALLMSLTVYAGSMQFVGVGLLAGGFAPLSALLLTLMVNARHIFYGLAMLTPFAGMGREKPYMVFALTDETFSLLVAAEPPEGVDARLYRLCIAVMDQAYWVLGSAIGGLLGTAFAFPTQGIEFVMTALFVVIFLEQWRTRNGRAPALMGVGVAAACRFIFGAQWFLLPTMAVLALLLLAARGKLDKGVDT